MAGFIDFLLLFSFMKLIRTMAAGTVFMAAAFAACQTGKSRTWRLNLALLALVPLAALMGYSKVFNTGRLWVYTDRVQRLLTPQLAASYFGIAAVFALRQASGCIRMRRALRQMQPVPEEEYPAFLRRRNGRRHIRLYITRQPCSPFAGGILRPYIAVPLHLKNSLSKEELFAVLYHEAAHIRHGHVLLLQVYGLLKILWWVHPLVHILDARLREFIEYGSDEAGVILGPLNVYEYARLLFRTLKTEQRCFPAERRTAFSGNSFAVLKKRFARLGVLQEAMGQDGAAAGRKYRKKTAAFAFLTAGMLASGACTIAATSWPRYTRMKEVALYDETLQLVVFGLEAEGFRAKAEGDKFSISGPEMKRLAERYRLRGEYAIFGYGTIMKLPGAGGLGQAAMVRISDVSDVRILGRRTWADKLQAFILKFLV